MPDGSAVNLTTSPRVAMSPHDELCKEQHGAWATGNFICIQLPLKAVRICWNTQLFLISLPFRCSYRIFTFIRQNLIRLLLGKKQDVSTQALQSFIGSDLKDEKELFKTVQELRAGSLLAIAKMDMLNRKFVRYKRQLASWKSTADNHTRQLTNIANEEKKHIRVIIAALKNLKKLKTSKDALDERFANALDDLSTFSKNMSSGSFEIVPNSPIVEMNAVLKAGYNRLHKQAEQMRNILENKNYFQNDRFVDDNENFLQEKYMYHAPINGLVENECMAKKNLLSLSMGALDTIVNLLSTENMELKKRLQVTNSHLEEMKDNSLSLNQKIASLENQLEDMKELLHGVEADRDTMMGKLTTLEGMIEEEEVFLNDDSSCDSYNELRVSTKEFRFSGIDCSSAVDNFGKIEHLELEWNSLESEDAKDLKSLELCLSR